MLLTLLLPLIFHAGAFYAAAQLDKTLATPPLLNLNPYFDSPILNVTAPIGREAVLTCRVNNLGTYKVGWMRADDQTILTLHTRVITHNPRISVTNEDNFRTWQLRIRQVKESDRGCYMCQINTNLMRKQLGCIDVQVPPDIVDSGTSSDITVSEGDNVTLTCNAAGHPSPRILWRREDGDYITLNLYPYTERVESVNNSRMELYKVDRRHLGAYLCIASNDVPPAVSKRMMVHINFAPVVKIPNQLLGTPLNTDVQLECNVEAFPNTINYWMKSREMIINGKKHSILEERQGYKVYMSLIIHNITRRDVGTYVCVATNSLGKTNGTIRLYEIKVHTLPPSTTTEKQRRAEKRTTTSTTTATHLEKFALIPEVTTLMEVSVSARNYYYYLPSVEPAPLETMSAGRSPSLSSAASSTVAHSNIFVFIATLLFIHILDIR